MLCVETGGAYGDKAAEQPDWDLIISDNKKFFGEAEALCVAGLNALRNGAVAEKSARDALTARYRVPFVMASELAGELNIMERGATALLNARLLPVIDQFMKAVGKALDERGIRAARTIVRSDGSLMSDEFARMRPVETILSGPAASVIGSRALGQCRDCLVVDMGGTTTDISVVRGGVPDMSGGISIGGWRTQIKGVFIDTFALGGDTRVYMKEGKLHLDTRRVEPLCSAAMRWPQVREGLEELLPRMRMHTRQLHEFLYLVRYPDNADKYTDGEKRLMEKLADGPRMIGGNVLDLYGNDSERLEREGIVMRCGLTPTDIMHIRGDYACFDVQTARLAARCFLKALPDYDDDQESMNDLCDDVYNLVKRRLFENIARVFIETGYRDICPNGIDDQVRKIIARQWEKRGAATGSSFFELRPDTTAVLIGAGAPTHIFLPDVADALGVRCIIPENSEVANAVGAAVADISAQATLSLHEGVTDDGDTYYTITAPGMREEYPTYEEAVNAAREAAGKMAAEEARRRGALGELTITVGEKARRSADKDGNAVDLGTKICAVATGRMGL